MQSYKKCNTFNYLKMDGHTDFESFYETSLKAVLTKFTPLAKRVYVWNAASMIGLLAGSIFFMISRPVAGLIFIILCIFSYYQYRKVNTKYRSEYKRKVIAEILQFLNPGTQYLPGKKVSQKNFIKSGLYGKRIDEYAGEDLIKGVYKNVSFYCSEICTREVMPDDYEGEIIFEGLFSQHL